MPGGFGPYLNGTMSRDAVPRLTDMAGREQFVASDDGFDVSLWDDATLCGAPFVWIG